MIFDGSCILGSYNLARAALTGNVNNKFISSEFHVWVVQRKGLTAPVASFLSV